MVDMETLLKRLEKEIEQIGTLEWGVVLVEDVQRPLRTLKEIVALIYKKK